MDSILPVVVGALPLGLVVLNEQAGIHYVNGFLRERLGLAEEELRGKQLLDLFPGVDSHALAEVLGRCQSEWEPNCVISDKLCNVDILPAGHPGSDALLRSAICFPFTGPDGDDLRAFVFYESMPSEAGNDFPASFSRALKAVQEARLEQRRLLEKVQQAQRHLVQSEKLAGIGQLAAGVAHEINTPIGYVFSNLRSLAGYVHDLLRIVDAVDVAGDLEEIRRLKQTLDYDFIRGDVEDLIAESEEGVERVKNIILALQDFSRTDSGEFALADLHRGIDTTINVAANELKYKAQVIKEYGELPRVECNISRINQVILNLLMNAAQAIPEQGVITIRTGTAGPEAWFEVEDTGLGMSPEEVDKLFEPFFTTKPVGEGTGLGLALSYGIVRRHHGRIEARSEAGKGSCFRVTLPIVHPEDKEIEEGEF